MSDDWQAPDDLTDRIRRLDRTDAWAREIERTTEVRAILTDLIAELREIRDSPSVRARKVSPWYGINLATDRAEVRLREVTGDE